MSIKRNSNHLPIIFNYLSTVGVAARQSIVSTAFNYLGVAIGAFNTLWLLPKAMTTGEIGLYRVIISMAVLCVPFAQLGIVQSSIKFFPGFKTKQERNNLLSALLILATAGYLLFLVIAWLFNDQISAFFETRSPEVKGYYDLVLILVMLMILFGILESYSRNHLQIIVPNLVREIQLRFLNSVLILLYLLQVIEFDSMLYALIINYTSIVLVMAIFLNAKYDVFPGLSLKGIKFKSLINYAIFTVLGTGGAVIVMQIDSILVSGLLGLKENGVYTTAFFIAVVVEIPRRAISQISSPMISNAFHDNDLIKVRSIYKKTSINLLLASVLIYSLIVLNLDELFYFIPDWQRFQAGKIVVILVGFGKLVDVSFGSNTEVIIMSKYFRFNILAILLLSVLTVLTNLWLIPIYGLMGAALATMISLMIYNFAKYIFIYIKLGIQPFSWYSFWAFLIGIGSFYGVYMLPPSGIHFIFDIIYRSLIFVLIFTGLNLLIGTSEDLTRIFKNMRKKLLG